MHQLVEDEHRLETDTRSGVRCTTATASRTGSFPEVSAYASYFRLPNGDTTICVLETSDCGAAESVILLVRAGLHALLSREPNIASAATALNRVLFAQSQRAASDNIVSGMFGVVDCLQRRLRFVSCGHDTALLFNRRGEPEHLPVDGPGLGAHADASFLPHEVGFVAGDVLVIASGGIGKTVGPAPRTDIFGSRRISSIFATPSSSKPGPEADAVIEGAIDFSCGPLIRDAAALVARAM